MHRTLLLAAVLPCAHGYQLPANQLTTRTHARDSVMLFSEQEVVAAMPPMLPSPRVSKSSSMVLSEQEVASAMEIKPVKAESARSTGLALALDDGTRKSHSMAENTQFVTGFFKGISTRSAFAQLVASLYFVYEAMETAFDGADDANVKALDYTELRRVPMLEDDMAYYFGDDWRNTIQPSPGAKAYCERIAAVAKDEPHLLVAHMYTRYLGDLFGGQMMSGMARSTLQLDKGKGTRFYEFDDIASTKTFIEEWYTKLNTLELSEEQKAAIVDEGNLVFALNIDIFNELEGGKRAAARAVWRLMRSAVRAKVKGMFQRGGGAKVEA